MVHKGVSAVTTGWTKQRILTGVGSVGVIAGAFLPWLSVSLLGQGRTIRGIDADGTITLVAAVVVGAAIAWKWAQATQIISILGGVVAGGLGVLYVVDPLFGVDGVSEAQKELLNVSIESGLFVTAAAGVLMLAAGAMGLVVD
jgi:hypothetical protein